MPATGKELSELQNDAIDHCLSAVHHLCCAVLETRDILRPTEVKELGEGALAFATAATKLSYLIAPAKA